MNAALNEYRQVGAHGGVQNASPHRLVQMLLQGATDRVASAKGRMQRGDVAGKGEHCSRAIRILDELRDSLDMERGGEIAANLDRLYEYMSRRIVEANMRDQPDTLDEVLRLLAEIRAGWDGIRDQVEGAREGVA